MNATNAERVASHMKEYGAKGILIHTVPGTPFWLVCQLNSQTNKWNITLCHPMHTKAYVIEDDISEDDHYKLWNELIKTELSLKVQKTLKDLVGSLKK